MLNTDQLQKLRKALKVDANGIHMDGAIYLRGNALQAGYVFEPDYTLESVEEHAQQMWSNKHLRAIPEAVTGEDGRDVVEIGAYQKGIVEELEKAHIYIEMLHKRIGTLEERLSKLEARLGK